MNPSEAKAILTTLTTAWPNADLPDETLRTWSQMLAAIPYQSAAAAADAVIRSDNWFPSIARFREAFGSARRDEQGEWSSSATCPICRGNTTVKDEQGRDWLCRCAAFERKTRVHNAVTAPPAALLAGARRLLKEAP